MLLKIYTVQKYFDQILLYCGAWWRISRVNAFRLKGRGFESHSSCHVETSGVARGSEGASAPGRQVWGRQNG